MSYRKLNLQPLAETVSLTWPENFEETTLDSSALTTFTDFTKVKPLVIEGNPDLEDAESFIKAAQARLKLVVNEEKQLVGILSLNDWNGERCQRLIASGTSRKEMKVMDLMTPCSELKVIKFSSIENSRIGDILETLKQEHLPYFLVLDSDTDKIRGIFSAAQMARHLKVPVEINKGPTFAEISHFVGGKSAPKS